MIRSFLLIVLSLLVLPASALIMVGRGNDPVTDHGWPTGALAVANLKSRVGWYEGPPFGGGEWAFLYRGDTVALAEAIKAFSAVRAAELRLVLHDGPQSSQFLKDDRDPNSDTRYDWSFTVWIPANWHRLYSNPDAIIGAESENFRRPVAAPRLDVYLTDKIDWSKIQVPAEITVVDERAPADAKKGAGATIKGDVFDMATGKIIPSATINLDKYTEGKYQQAMTAAADGAARFNIGAIPAGTYRISATAQGYAPRVLGYHEIKDGTTKKMAIELSKAVSINGTVTAEGKPLAGVKVYVFSSRAIDGREYSGTDRAEMVTDEKGGFTLANLPSGYVSLSAHMKGYHKPGVPKLVATDKKTVAIEMIATGAISGKVAVKRPDHHPQISISPVLPPGQSTIGTWGASGNCKADGSFAFENVPPGEYWISTQSIVGGVIPAGAQKFKVEAGKTVELSL